MDKYNPVGNPGDSPYDRAFKVACEALRSANIEERAGKSGAYFEKEGGEHCLIRLPFFNRYCSLHFPDITIAHQDEGENLSLWSKLIILHYIIQAQGHPLAGEWISFRQLSGGEVYYPAFDKRSQKPLLRFFAHRGDLLEAAGRALGGMKAPTGDRGTVITALPRVPIVFLLWNGDEELPSDARILFDASVSAYLSTEDVVVLAQQGVLRLIEQGRALEPHHKVINH